MYECLEEMGDTKIIASARHGRWVMQLRVADPSSLSPISFPDVRPFYLVTCRKSRKEPDYFEHVGDYVPIERLSDVPEAAQKTVFDNRKKPKTEETIGTEEIIRRMSARILGRIQTLQEPEKYFKEEASA